MLSRIAIAAVTIFGATIGFSAAAFAGCACDNQTAYTVSQDRGVIVMRGNIPKMHNPKWGLISERKAAEARADTAERRARRAERDAATARAALADTRSRPSNFDRNSHRDRSPYFSGNYGFGASISAPKFRGRGHKGGFRGAKGLSQPVFTTRIRG